MKYRDDDRGHNTVFGWFVSPSDKQNEFRWKFSGKQPHAMVQ